MNSDFPFGRILVPIEVQEFNAAKQGDFSISRKGLMMSNATMSAQVPTHELLFLQPKVKNGTWNINLPNGQIVFRSVGMKDGVLLWNNNSNFTWESKNSTLLHGVIQGDYGSAIFGSYNPRAVSDPLGFYILNSHYDREPATMFFCFQCVEKFLFSGLRMRIKRN
jgi:hypothetical protein